MMRKLDWRFYFATYTYHTHSQLIQRNKAINSLLNICNVLLTFTKTKGNLKKFPLYEILGNLFLFK
jgi:hypothetical protein